MSLHGGDVRAALTPPVLQSCMRICTHAAAGDAGATSVFQQVLDRGDDADFLLHLTGFGDGR